MRLATNLRNGVLIRLAEVSMHNLALTYSALGKHTDALAMREQVLEFRRRVLPADHPEIGEGCAGRDAFHAASVDCEAECF